MISIRKKILDEVDVPTNSRIISDDEDKLIIKRESSWTDKIKGIDSFPNGTVEGHGNSGIFANGISISDWQGILTIEMDRKFHLLERILVRMANTM
jgi:hypothetical protein